MISYSPDQVDFILERFVTHGDTPQAHSQTWCRRLYAPMYIFEPELADVRRRLEDAYPEHVIAFDIVFQSRGNATDWHTDYESLGPFIVRDAFAAMTASHFVSIHANLTKEGVICSRATDRFSCRGSIIGRLCLRASTVGCMRVLSRFADHTFTWPRTHIRMSSERETHSTT